MIRLVLDFDVGRAASQALPARVGLSAPSRAAAASRLLARGSATIPLAKKMAYLAAKK
jgi:hypothetical protein